MINIAPGIALADSEVQERFVRASGPGGQNINKVATAVELRFDIRQSSLPHDVQARLIALAGRRVSTDGVLIIDSRIYRSQARNREAALDRLVALIQRSARKPRSRRPTRPSAAAREKRLTDKKQRGAVKARRTRRDDDA
jgi:ribosome-associated protein